MTRAHVRLLGPCFKTGPESTQSSSVVDRYIRSNIKSRSEDTVDQQPRQTLGNGARSVKSERDEPADGPERTFQMRLNTV